MGLEILSDELMRKGEKKDFPPKRIVNAKGPPPCCLLSIHDIRANYYYPRGENKKYCQFILESF